MITNMQVPIQLPPPNARSRGLLVQEGTPIPVEDFRPPMKDGNPGPDRLGMGVQHVPWGCAPLRTGNVACDPDVLLKGDGPAYDSGGDIIDGNVDEGKADAILNFDDVEFHPSFKIVDGLTCTVLGMADENSSAFTGMTARLNNRSRVLASEALMTELVTGWASNGPALIDGTTLTAAANIGAAAQAVEDHLAATLHNGQGIVYIPPRLLAAAVAAYWVIIVGNRLETVTGHRVVSDAGHNGILGKTPDGTKRWIYASGPVGFRIGATKAIGEGSETLDLFHNQRLRIVESVAQLAFDPCAVAGILVG